MKARFFIVFLSLVSGVFGDYAFADQSLVRDDGLTVRYDGLREGAAREVVSLYSSVRVSLARQLGWQSEVRPEVILVKDRAEFRRFSGSDRISAVAITNKDRIVIDYSKMGGRPFTMETTLKHELCHLELHHYVSEGVVPRWLDEGVCQWVTGGVSEMLTVGGKSLLSEAALSGRMIPIGRLTDGFPSDDRGLLLAYEESKNIVEYIVKVYGVSALRAVLGRLHDGDDLETAVQEGLQISMEDLEKKWKASLAPRDVWPIYIRDNLYEILFLFAAAATVIGFFRALKRRQEYKDDDEDDATGQEGDGDEVLKDR